MAVTLSGSDGLFTRLGKLIHLIDTQNSRFGGGAAGDFDKELNDYLVELDGASNEIRRTVDGIHNAYDAFRNANVSQNQSYRRLAEGLLVEMVDADDAMATKTVRAALQEIIRQMEDADASVDASVVSASSVVDGPRRKSISGATQADPVVITSTAHGLADGDVVTVRSVGGMTEINDRQFTVNSTAANTFELVGENGTGHTAYTSGGYWRANNGNHGTIVSILDGKGRSLENAMAEDAVAIITNSATAGSESGTVSGEALEVSDKLDDRWPNGTGSGGTVSCTILDPSTAGYLTNGDMENFTSDAPDDWTVTNGTAGTEFDDDNANEYRGTMCLKISGSTTLMELRQTVTDLESRTPYPVSVRMKRDGTAASAGTLILDLYDTDASAVVTDESGAANSVSIDLTALEQTYQLYTGVFRVPEEKPTNMVFRIRVSVALTTGRDVYLDDVLFGTAMTELYPAGPFVAKVRGSVNAGLDDTDIITVTNGREGEFQTAFARLFNQPDLLLPSNSAGAETIADTLIS